MNWLFGLDLDVLRSQKGFLMIEVLISGIIVSIMVMLLYQTILLLSR
jgi:Tfp pilus assembly protein PilV